MEFEMLAILLVFLLTRTSLSEIYDLTADEIFKSVIGDVYENRKKIDPAKIISELRALENISYAKLEDDVDKMIIINETHVRMRVDRPTTTTTQRATEPTVRTTEMPPNITTDYLKTRMRKIQLNQLLETHTNPIPDFSEDSDGAAQITRRFQAIAIDLRNSMKPSLRGGQHYFWHEYPTRLRREKYKTIALMEQFIYATRYKMPYMQLLRKKYSHLLKYKIGYCFALVRHLKQQQMLLYSALHRYHREYTNLMIHLRLYEKILRLDVDIKDVCFLIRRMNYQVKLEEDPEYYDDEPENVSPIVGAGPNMTPDDRTLPTTEPAPP